MPSWAYWSAGMAGALVAGILIGALVGAGSADSKADDAAAPLTAREETSGVPSPTPAATAATPDPTPSADPPEADPAADALATLATIAVVDGHSDYSYDRGLYGEPWTDVDRNGCDTRNDILGRDLLNPVFKPGTNDCKVVSGTLIDPYDGTTTDFESGWGTSVLVQIDHVVALAWSWHHGADAWSDERRLQFANDPRNLIAASEAVNQEKSAYGPSEWMPPLPDQRCRYIADWVGVLDAYELGINPADKAAAQAVLEGC